LYSRFSPNFVAACKCGELREGGKIPCPKCGDGDVVFINPRIWLRLAGIIGAVAALLFFFGQTIVAEIVAIGAVGVAVSSLGTEPSYRCRHCGHGWRHRDALKWAAAIMHDEESRAKSRENNP
jgi:DNA-directed RNA polymerase subunit RPC12/RpoP